MTDPTPQARPVEQEIAADRESLIVAVARGFHEFVGGHPDYPLYDEVACGGSPEYHCEAGHEHGSRGVCWACEPPSAHIVDAILAPLIARERAAAAKEALTEAADAVARREDKALIAALLAMECNEPARMVSDWIGEMLREIEEMLRDRADRIGGDPT